jgi:hypothetical protein
MNRLQKIQFIRTNHQKLYKQIQEEIPSITEVNWVYSNEEKILYNNIVEEYCKAYNLSLKNMLVL